MHAGTSTADLMEKPGSFSPDSIAPTSGDETDNAILRTMELYSEIKGELKQSAAKRTHG